MQVPVFRAKDLDSDKIVEGFYFEYPAVNNFMQGMMGMENAQSDVPVVSATMTHSLISYKPGMMGIVNEPVGCTIDLSTLEFVRFVEIPCDNAPIIM